MRSRRPPPHDTEHADHADHTARTQSRAHGCVEHATESESGGQSLAAIVTLREREMVPPPHDTEHGDQFDQAETPHAHAGCVHGCDSLSAPHIAPPLAGGATTDRVRRCSPVPHACEHVLQFDHMLSWQSVAHAAVEHASLSPSDGHGVPPHDASVVAVRVRARVPLPHVAEHAAHDDHVDTMHATGQQPKPQFTDSLSDGHGVPPLAVARVVVRVRDLLAVAPHVAVHADHCAHCDTSQSTGGSAHAGCMHAIVSDAVPAHEPPHDCVDCTLRVRVCVPAPHVTEQPDHAPNADHTQSTGQQPPLAVHASLSLSTSHEPPHDSADCLTRERERVPLPHVTEHAENAVHCPSTQLTAQHEPPHGSDSDRSVGHELPPHAATTVMARVRVCVPPPHCCEHALHWPQVPTWQCCGQQPVLHDCESATCDVEHVPPHDSGVIERERDCEPPPHGAEQPPHADQPPITQLDAQQPVLHDCDCVVSDSLHEPPHDAGVMERERDCEPPPQPTEHEPHDDQPPMLQFCGQQPGLQPRDSDKLPASGHEPPFASGTVM